MGLIPQLKVRVPMEWIRQPSAAGKVARKSKRKIMEPKQTRSQCARVDRDVIEHARIAHSERLSGAGSTWIPCNTGVGSTWSPRNTGAGSTWSPCNSCRRTAPMIIPAINAVALKAAESYPCENSRGNSHGITSLHKTQGGVGPVTTQLTPGAEPDYPTASSGRPAQISSAWHLRSPDLQRGRDAWNWALTPARCR